MKKCKKCGAIEASDSQVVCEKCLCPDFIEEKKESKPEKKKGKK